MSPSALSGGAAGSTVAPSAGTGPVKRAGRLQWSFLFANLVFYGVAAAVSTVLLPVQLQGVDEARKATLLGTALSAGAVAAMLTQPVVGWFSDRTRSRLGRRSPYILAGGFLTAGCLVGLGLAGTTAIAIGAGWCMVQVSLNVLKSPQQTIVADRVPQAARGTTSMFIGLGTMLGGVGGSLFASQMTSSIRAAYVVLAVAFAGVAVAFVLLNPDKGAVASAAPTPRAGAAGARFPLNPRRYPSFTWLFVARFLMVLGYMWYGSYNLYLLQDYIGLSQGRAIAMVPLFSVISLVSTVAANTVTGPLSDRLGRRRVFLVVAAALIASGLVLPMLAPVLLAMVAGAVLAGLGFGTFTAMSIATMTEVLPDPAAAGRDLGIMNMASTLAQSLSPLLAASVIGGAANRYGLMLGVGAASVVLSAFAFHRVKELA